MYQPKTCCQETEDLKGTPQGCSPKQIQECHGAAKDHPFVPPNISKP